MNHEHMILTTFLQSECKKLCIEELKIDIWKRIKEVIYIEREKEKKYEK